MSISGKRQMNSSAITEIRPDCPSPVHGTGHAYRRMNCKCPDTMKAIAIAQQEYRDRKKSTQKPVLMDSTEAHRMLRALFAAGWTGAELSERLGYNGREGAVQLLRSQKVHPDTYERILRCFRELSNLPGASQRTRDRARRSGWAVPYAWDPETIADPDAKPDTGVRPGGWERRMSTQETLFEYEYHKGLGLRHADILEEMGITQSAYDKAVSRSKE